MANKVLQRICCCCRKLQPVTEMTRVVRVADNFIVEHGKRLNGRGAYLCAVCREKPDARKALSRSFKTAVPETLLKEM